MVPLSDLGLQCPQGTDYRYAEVRFPEPGEHYLSSKDCKWKIAGRGVRGLWIVAVGEYREARIEDIDKDFPCQVRETLDQDWIQSTLIGWCDGGWIIKDNTNLRFRYCRVSKNG